MAFFDEKIERLQTSSVKWDMTKEIFGKTDLLPMWVADMDFRPPQEVSDAIKRRVEHGIFGYTFVPPSVHSAISNWQKKRHNWDIQHSWLLFCSGIVPAISTAIQAYSQPGDKILLQSPIYTPFFEMIEKNGRVVVNSQLVLQGGRYEIDFTDLEKKLQQGCKLFLLCNPHNPGGRSWSKEELIKIGKLCLKYNCLILSDEIHSDILYKNSKHYPIASLNQEISQHALTCIAPSKTFNLAVQTSAIIIENKDLREKYNDTLKRQGFFTLNALGIAGMEAAYRYGEAWLNELLDYLEDNKEIVKDFLQNHLPGISLMDSDGTYLLWIYCRGLSLKDDDIQKRLIEKGKLALEPGAKYGPGGEGFVRMNIACPREMLMEGLSRLQKAFS